MVGTTVMIHRGGLVDGSSRTDRTVPKNLEPFRLSSAGSPRYWAKRQRRASTGRLFRLFAQRPQYGQTLTV